MDKAFILSEIKRTAAENGGNALGMNAFATVTGIKPHLWQLFWNRWSDALRDAEFKPNEMAKAYSESELIEALIGLTLKLRQFPIRAEIIREARNNPPFPSPTHGIVSRLGGKAEAASKVIAFCEKRPEFDEVIQICLPISNGKRFPKAEGIPEAGKAGHVYLWKSHRRYKIGKSFDLERRKNELAAQSPYEWKRIHEIKTDDPSGVEAYWHRRFADKRTERNEWFELTSDDVKAFKRWRNIF
jgi:hypothetical protein